MPAVENGPWRIRGYNGSSLMFEDTAPRHLSAPEMVTLLQRLVSRCLTEREVIAASLRKGSRGYAGFLEPRQETKKGQMVVFVGLDPYYVADLKHRETA